MICSFFVSFHFIKIIISPQLHFNSLALFEWNERDLEIFIILFPTRISKQNVVDC